MPKPRLYHKRIDVLTTREQWREIARYAKHHKLRWGEAVRELIATALDGDHDGVGRNDA